MGKNRTSAWKDHHLPFTNFLKNVRLSSNLFSFFSAILWNVPREETKRLPGRDPKRRKSPWNGIGNESTLCFSWYYTAFANASNSANKSHLSIFCVPNQPLSTPKWQSGSSMTLKLIRHRTIESCGSMSSLHKAACARIQMFVPLHGQPNANDHMYTSFCSILILMYHKDGKFANIKSERFC